MGFGEGAGPEKLVRDFRTESADAASGGITTFLSTSLFGKKPLNEYFDEAMQAASGNSYIDFKINLASGTVDQIEEIPGLCSRGANMYKFFMGYKGTEAEFFGMPKEGMNLALLSQGFETLAKVGRPAIPMIHAEEPYVGDVIHEKVRQKNYTNLLAAFNDANPAICETIDIFKAAEVAKVMGAPLYVVHVSAKESVDLIAYLQKTGV